MSVIAPMIVTGASVAMDKIIILKIDFIAWSPFFK